MTESAEHYTKSINDSRNLFLGVLGHDLRNPIGAATMAARAMVERGGTDARQLLLASQIVTTTERATQILNDLLDVTLSAFGTDIPVVRAPMDMGQLGTQLAEEWRTVYDSRAIEVDVAGTLKASGPRLAWGRCFRI